MGTPGTYVMVIRISRETRIAVGKLGEFSFTEGFYCYAGSAMGPGGLTARLARHLRPRRNLHWHVDYLLQHGLVVATWQVRSTEKLECVCAQTMLSLDGAQAPVQGFGSSDCSCETHLIYFSSHPSYGAFRKRLGPQGAYCSICTHTPPRSRTERSCCR